MLELKMTKTVYSHTGTIGFQDAIDKEIGSDQEKSLDTFTFRNGRTKLYETPSFGLKGVPYSDPDATHLAKQKPGETMYFVVNGDICEIYSQDDCMDFMRYPDGYPDGLISYDAIRSFGYSGIAIHYDPITMDNDSMFKGLRNDCVIVWNPSAIQPICKEIADIARIAECPDPSIDQNTLIEWMRDHISELQQAIDNDILLLTDVMYVSGYQRDIYEQLHDIEVDRSQCLPAYGLYETLRDTNGNKSDHEIETGPIIG